MSEERRRRQPAMLDWGRRADRNRDRRWLEVMGGGMWSMSALALFRIIGVIIHDKWDAKLLTQTFDAFIYKCRTRPRLVGPKSITQTDCQSKDADSEGIFRAQNSSAASV